MNFLAGKISENYDDFMKHHKQLSDEVTRLSLEFKEHIQKMKYSASIAFSDKDLNDLQLDIKGMKEEISKLQKDHTHLIHTLDDIKKEKHDVKDLKEKFQAGELEMFLLKERMVEKDEEIKQIKDVNSHLFNIVKELSNLEIDLVNRKLRKK